METNPFGVKNPEDLDPEYIVRFFVDMFTDLPRISAFENTFVHGARGTGKSMLMRRLEASVMLKVDEQSFADLPYVGVHVPLRKADFSMPELSRPRGAAGVALGEHLLSMHVTFRFARLLKSILQMDHANDIHAFANEFLKLYVGCGGQLQTTVPAPTASISEHCAWIEAVCEAESIAARQYIKRLPFSDRPPPYNGALTGYFDFLLPLAERFRSLDSMPHVPIFVMLDDADNLPAIMQRVLNSWVSTRSVHTICLKISTQLGYETFRTLDGRLIESPHDFSEVDIGSVYTKSRDRFSQRIFQVVERRLFYAGIDADPRAFFPTDVEQQARVKEIGEQLRQEWSERQEKGVGLRGGTRARDDVARYAIPRLMQELAGSAKSSHTFSYAGFDSLVDLSSGIVRWFLEPAARMFDEVASRSGEPVISIPIGVQDRIVYAWSKEFIDKLLSIRSDEHAGDNDLAELAVGPDDHVIERLYNLVTALGNFFRKRLLDRNASEQRVFSVVVRGEISKELEEVLACGVRLGYLQRADNAAKEVGAGRRPRYILARRLGPYFKLDVSGHAAHLSVTAKALLIAIRDPKRFVGMRAGEEVVSGAVQLKLLPEGGAGHDSEITS